MLRAAAVLALLPAVAAADPVETDEQAQLRTIRQLAFNGIEHSFDLEAHASVAGLAGRQTGGRAVAGGEIAWNVGVCRALFAGAEGTLEQAQGSGSVWGGFCMPFTMNRMELVVRSDYALQPTLAALPVAQRARYAGVTVELRNAFVGWKTATKEHAILPLSFSLGTFEQPIIDVGKASFAIAAYRRTHASGRMIEIAPIALRSAGPAIPAAEGGIYLSANASEFSPFRLVRTEAGALGPFAIEADFAAGLAYATLTEPPPSRSASDMSTVLFRDVDLYADATLRATRGDDTFSLHLRRAFEPTYTDELLLDTRAEAMWRRTSGKHALLAGVFGAVTRRMDRRGPIASTPSGGLRGAYSHELPHHTQLALSAEVARSFYAALDDALAVGAAWSAQLAATFAFTRPKAAVATP